MSGARGARSGRLVMLALVVMVAAGCQLEVQVGIDVADDGTGEVRVAGALDQVAASRVPDLADQLEVHDLVDAGWTVTGPSLEADGRTWITASKPFSSPEEAGAVLDEISGEDGPFRDFEVRRSSSLLRHQWEFTGYVDLAAGLAGFSDDALRERLDGTDVGQSEEELVAAAGRALSDMFAFRVAVALPGDVTSNAPGSLEGGAVWRPALGEQLALTATGTQLNVATLLWLAMAVAVGLALVVLLVVRVRRRRARVTVPAQEPFPVPGGAAAPEPAAVPDGAAAPEPAAVPDGAAAPEPTAASEGTAAPGPGSSSEGGTAPEPPAVTEDGEATEPTAAPAPSDAPVGSEDAPAGPAAGPSDGPSPAGPVAGLVAGPSDAADGEDPAGDPSADDAALPVERAAAEPDAAEPDAAEPDAAEPDAAEPDAAEPGAEAPSDDADDPAPTASEASEATGTAPASGETGHVDRESQRTVTE